VAAVVLDIEGTTTPISFVYETLFPYARARMRGFLAATVEREDVEDAVRLLCDEQARESGDGAPPPRIVDAPPQATRASAAAYADWLMDRDRKSPGLKRLQGLIWERGYEDGTLRGEVFPDVPPALRQWHDQGVPVGIYSSGSVLAQRLLFGRSTAGDLTPFIEAYFDTATGPKQSPASYRRVAAALGVPVANLLFVSDVPAELDAASTAGCKAVLCCRPGNPSVPGAVYRRISTFEELDFRG
jgi:enolase-phosphatase E1